VRTPLLRKEVDEYKANEWDSFMFDLMEKINLHLFLSVSFDGIPNFVREKVWLLRNYFSERADVSAAFIFGSYVKGNATSESDFDVAVYFKPEGEAVEWEETKLYREEDKVWRDVEKLVGLRTDLVVLNRAPSTLASSVLQEGEPIVIKDRSLYLRFLLTVSSAAENFREFVDDFWEIKERTKSLSAASFALNSAMSRFSGSRKAGLNSKSALTSTRQTNDREHLIRIVDFLESELVDRPKFEGLERKTYDANSSVRRDVERWAENIINASIDIAKILLASAGKRIPLTYREALEKLSLLESFDSAVTEEIARFSRLRNILAHEYLDIRSAQIKGFIEDSEAVYEKFVEFAKNMLRKS
jgi:uncharacterized protein YutE (UPF0331/DUF86 family)/predicted nucleotidyltransferase